MSETLNASPTLALFCTFGNNINFTALELFYACYKKPSPLVYWVKNKRINGFKIGILCSQTPRVK